MFIRIPVYVLFQSAAYSRNLYNLYNTKDERDALERNRKDAEAFTKKLKQTGEEMKDMQYQTMKDLKQEMKDFDITIDGIEEKYKDSSAELRETYKTQLEQESTKIKNRFDIMKRSNEEILDTASEAIMLKIRRSKAKLKSTVLVIQTTFPAFVMKKTQYFLISYLRKGFVTTLLMFCLLNPQMNACEPNPKTTSGDFNR